MRDELECCLCGGPLGPVVVFVVVVGDVVVLVVVVGVVVVVLGDVVVVVVVVVVELEVDPGVVVEVDVVVAIVIVPPQLDDKRVTEVAGSDSGGDACAATSARVSGTEAGIETVSVCPSTKDTVMTHVDAEDAVVVVVPAVSVSADATGIAHSPSPTRNVAKATSAARRRLPGVIVLVGSCASASAIPQRGGPPRSHPGPGNYRPFRRFATWNHIPGDCRPAAQV